MNQIDDTKALLTAENVRKKSVGWMLNALTSSLNKDMSKHLKNLDLSIGKFSILMTLLEEDGLTQTTICKRTMLASYTMTRNLDSLEKAGLLKRHPDEDSRRSLRIRLTSKGLALAPTLFSLVKEVNQELLEGLSEAEIDQFQTTLHKLLQGKVDR